MATVREDTVKLSFEVDDKGLNKANDAVDDLIDKTEDLGEDGTKKAEDGFKKAHKEAQKFGDTKLDKLSDGIDKIVSGVGKFALKAGTTAIKGIAAGAAAGTTALIGLGTAAVKGYAEYEQLVGGVETLFGAGGQSLEEYAKSTGQTTHECVGEYKNLLKAQDMMLTNANDAYKNAGMSANDYMSNVTAFSASLISSLDGDTVAAAKAADQAMIDMSDNANKMGTDIDSIVQTYQSLSRGNYAMLDNLKLGYGGTKAEMERLLKDAEKLTGKKFDISNFADITEAIHAIQTEMGITGTTAKEASETIQGSAMAMKSAWQNFLVGMADEEADFDQLMNNLVDSVKTFLKNVIPRIKKMLPRLVKGLTEITKTIGKELPGLMEDLLPSLIDGAADLTRSLFGALIDFLPMFKDIGLNIVKSIYKGITGKEMPDDMFAKLTEKVDQAFEAVKKITVGIVNFAKKLWVYVGPALVWIGDLALDAFSWIGDNINWILPVLGSLLGAMLAFKAIKRVTGLVSGFMGLFGKKGKGGAGGGADGGGGFLGSFAKMKPGTILKAMLNIGIIVAGIAGLAFLLAWAAPYFKELVDGGSFMMLLTAMGLVGLVGTGLAKLAGSVGRVKVGTVVKGVANIGISLIAIGGLTLLLGWITSLMDFDFAEMTKLILVIGLVGLVGGLLTALASILGLVPVQVVAMGLANMAILIAGFTAIVAAYGALALIPGFNDFMEGGGEVLTTLCGILGEMVGSVIGGIGEGITDSLPAIGENLSAFAESLEPMFTTFASVDSTGLKDFATALGALILVLAGESLLSLITGGIDYAGLGTNLSTMATNLSGFFSTIMEFPEGCFEKATALFDCLAGISSMPKEGGVVGWFQGEVDYSKMATGLEQLGGEGVIGFFTAVQGIPEAAFTAASNLFNCLAGIKSLPKDGGVVGWFAGEVDYATIASGIAELGSETMIAALTAIAEIPESGFTALSNLFTTLAGVSALPKEGGIFGWFTGDSTEGLTSVAAELPGVATNIASFFTNLGGITDFTPISDLFNTLGNIKVDTDVAEKGFFGGMSDLATAGQGLSDFATNASTFFDTVNTMNAENISTFFDTVGEAGDLPTQLEGVDETLGTTLSNMVTTVESGMKKIKDAITAGLDAAIAIIKGKYTGMYSSGAFIMAGLNAGILSKESAVMATVRRIAENIKKTFDDAQKISSPAKAMIPSGEWTTAGVAVGMRNMLPEVESAANDVSKATSIPYVERYSPDGGDNSYYSESNSGDVITISPVFNLQISGSQDDRVLARKVKRYVSEAIEDTLDSWGRKSSPVREV